MKVYKVYARVDENNIVQKIFTDVFQTPQTNDVLIDANNTDRHKATTYTVRDNYGIYNYCIKNGMLAERDKTADLAEYNKTQLRYQRKTECFEYINRGELWYNTLTYEQKTELQQWYKQWLDVTITMTPPAKPQWLN